MTAAQAQAITKRAQDESPVDYVLRVHVYPRIEVAASHGQHTTVFWPPWQPWCCRRGENVIGDACAQLTKQGYAVTHICPAVDGPEEVRVSW